nr:MAG TPA: Protein of unknown function (DUF2905) [Crassvirales sp.]
MSLRVYIPITSTFRISYIFIILQLYTTTIN